MNLLLASKVGEGFQKPDADSQASISIRYNATLKRLEELRKLPQNWRTRLATIHSNVVEQYRKLAPAMVERVNQSGELPLDYFMAQRVRETLKDGAEKTLFGGLAGEAGIWNKIVVAYEKQNVWMGEACLQMQRCVDYELPYLKKSAASADAQVQALQRRHAELLKSAHGAAQRFAHDCERLGVAGADLAREVSALPLTLPAEMQPLLTAVQADVAKDSARLYAAFVSAVVQDGGDAAAEHALPVVHEIQSGTVSFDRALIPAQTDALAAVAPPGAHSGSAEAPEPVLELDLDLSDLDLTLDEGAGVAGAESATQDDAKEIDWGMTVESAHDAGDGDGEGNAGAIDWDISLEPEQPGDAEAQARNAADAQDQGVAAAPEASSAGLDVDAFDSALLRVAYDGHFRGALVAELHELRAFLDQRLIEEEAGATDVTTVPESVVASASTLRDMRACVGEGLDVLERPQVKTLLSIAASKKYSERLARDLTLRRQQERKLLDQAAEVQNRLQDVQRQLMSFGPKEKEQVAYLREIATRWCAELGRLLGRTISLTGDITNYIQ